MLSQISAPLGYSGRICHGSTHAMPGEAQEVVMAVFSGTGVDRVIFERALALAKEHGARRRRGGRSGHARIGYGGQRVRSAAAGL
jgi:hypothetical protein